MVQPCGSASTRQLSTLDGAKKLLRARIQAEEYNAWVGRWYEIVKATKRGSILVEGQSIFDFIAMDSDAEGVQISVSVEAH